MSTRLEDPGIHLRPVAEPAEEKKLNPFDQIQLVAHLRNKAIKAERERDAAIKERDEAKGVLELALHERAVILSSHSALHAERDSLRAQLEKTCKKTEYGPGGELWCSSCGGIPLCDCRNLASSGESYLGETPETKISPDAVLPDSNKAAPEPEKKCIKCGVSLNEGEAKCFTVCSDCWDKTYSPSPQFAPERRYTETQIETAAGTADGRVCDSRSEPHDFWWATFITALRETGDK